jgi:hypothetical protein
VRPGTGRVPGEAGRVGPGTGGARSRRRARRAKCLAQALGLALMLCPIVAGAQRQVTGSVTASFLEHRVNAGSGVERASGALFGGLVSVSAGPWLEVHGHARGGTLSADTSLAEDRGVAELELGASAVALPWLAFQLAMNVRGYSTELARQRWVSVRAGAEGRFSLLDERLRGLARLTLMPVVSVGGLASPDLALGGAVGLEYRSGILQAGLVYSMERYDFPQRAAGRRLEQVSGLGVRIGVRYDIRSRE